MKAVKMLYKTIRPLYRVLDTLNFGTCNLLHQIWEELKNSTLHGASMALSDLKH